MLFCSLKIYLDATAGDGSQHFIRRSLPDLQIVGVSSIILDAIAGDGSQHFIRRPLPDLQIVGVASIIVGVESIIYKRPWR